MKSHLLIVVCFISCLLILFFLYFPNKIYQNPNPIKKIENPVTIINNESILIEWTQMIERYLTFPLDNHYGSHAIVLLAAVYVSQTGPILEMGMGPTSSPLLHRLSLEQNRYLLSADSDIRWINYFSSFASNSSLHRLKYVEVKTEMGVEWAKMGFEDYAGWTVVFLDHRPGPRRQFDLMFYSQHSDIVVLHDTEQSYLYQYAPALRLYHFQYRFTKLKTYTDVLSRKNETLIKRIRDLLELTPNKYFLNMTSKEKI